MFENVDGRTDGRTTDGRTTDAGVTGILIAHLGAFGSGELKNEACKIKYACLSIFMHHFCIIDCRNPYSEPTSYYENRSLCKHGKIAVRHFFLTYFRLGSDVILFPLKSSKLRQSIILILGFNNIQL